MSQVPWQMLIIMQLASNEEGRFRSLLVWFIVSPYRKCKRQLSLKAMLSFSITSWNFDTFYTWWWYHAYRVVCIRRWLHTRVFCCYFLGKSTVVASCRIFHSLCQSSPCWLPKPLHLVLKGGVWRGRVHPSMSKQHASSLSHKSVHEGVKAT